MDENERILRKIIVERIKTIQTTQDQKKLQHYHDKIMSLKSELNEYRQKSIKLCERLGLSIIFEDVEEKKLSEIDSKPRS